MTTARILTITAAGSAALLLLGTIGILVARRQRRLQALSTAGRVRGWREFGDLPDRLTLTRGAEPAIENQSIEPRTAARLSVIR